MELRKFCVITREQAKIIKNKPRHSPEFVLLENMSNRMEQMNKCISKMRQENKEIMENVINMMKFQQQFTKFEKDFRRKINYLKGRGQELLEKAVFSYEEKDEFVAKQKVFEDRRSQDLRKTAITENALNLSLQRMEKNDKFAELQGTMRIDNRIAEASDMIEKGITGLEPGMEGMQNLQTAISAAAGEDTPEKMEESFRKSGDNIDMALSYLDEILKEINHLQGEINRLKKEIKQLTKSMSFSDRKFRKEIELSQDVAQKKLEEADEASKSTEEARNELNSAFDIVKQLYTSCCPDDAHSLEQIPIDETNVIDYLQKMEKKLLDYLICNEYMRMKEASEDDKPVILEEDKDEDIEDEVQEIERVGIVQPRTLLSETDLHSVREVDTDTETQFLQFEALKERAVAEIQSGKSGDETDASE